jgi:hypothetical protein
MKEIDKLVSLSKLMGKYAETEESESAYEILTAKIGRSCARSEADKESREETKPREGRKINHRKSADNSVTRQIGRTAANVITRSLLGALGLGGKSSTRRKKNSWF